MKVLGMEVWIEDVLNEVLKLNRRLLLGLLIMVSCEDDT